MAWITLALGGLKRGSFTQNISKLGARRLSTHENAKVSDLKYPEDIGMLQGTQLKLGLGFLRLLGKQGEHQNSVLRR